MKKPEQIALRYFDKSVTDRERAIFEGAIALGAIYHQFIGMPLNRNRKVLRAIEEAMSAAMSLQPYREKVIAKISPSTISRRKRHAYDYESLTGKNLDIIVKTRYRKAEATLRMKFLKQLNYPLMFVEAVKSMGR